MPAASDVFPGIPFVESPLFEAELDRSGLTPAEREVAVHLHDHGYAVIDFPDPQIDERIDRIQARLSPSLGLAEDGTGDLKALSGRRVQDAWRFDEDVHAIAANTAVLDLLTKLYGRRAFPFQTLNFPVGTQQALHTDAVHFSSIPERFMCGVWLAMEDVGPDSGPLTYVPGSHRWPVLSNIMIGRQGWQSNLRSAQHPYGDAWSALIAAEKAQQETFQPRKGQALIWCANLLHGGMRRKNTALTRWSQVTHYYFDDCIYYTPAFSDEALGRLALREVVDLSTGEAVQNRYLGEVVKAPHSGTLFKPSQWTRKAREAWRKLKR